MKSSLCHNIPNARTRSISLVIVTVGRDGLHLCGSTILLGWLNQIINGFSLEGITLVFVLRTVDFLNNRQSMPIPTYSATILRSRRGIMVGTVYLRWFHAPHSTPRQAEITSTCVEHVIINMISLWPYTPVALVHLTHVIAVGENADSRGYSSRVVADPCGFKGEQGLFRSRSCCRRKETNARSGGSL